MEFLILYIFVRLEELSASLSNLGGYAIGWTFGVVAIAAISVLFHALITDASAKETAAWVSKVVKALKLPLILLLTVGALASLVGALLPTPKQAAIIFAGGYAYKAVTSEKGQEVLGKLGSKVEFELNKLLDVPVEQVEK